MKGSQMTAMPVDADERRAPPATLVIFGASGDLTARKLVPALKRLAYHKRLPDEFAVVGVARSPMTDEEFRAKLSNGPDDGLLQRFRYLAGGYDDPDTYARLSALLEELDAAAGTGGGRVFYLSTPAQAFEPVVRGLTASGLNRPATPTGFAR